MSVKFINQRVGLVLIGISLALAVNQSHSVEQQSVRQQQQQNQRQQQQDAEQLRNSLQAPYGVGGSLEFASLLADNLVNLGPPGGSSKRARKMSAFMPMRGRKDGRDQRPEQFDSMGEAGGANDLIPLLLINNGSPLIRDSDDSNILHLARANALLASSDGSRPGGVYNPSGAIMLSSTPAPRQFANQFAFRHQLDGSGPSLPAPGLAEQQQMGREDSLGGFRSVAFEPMMQAKLRRAFQPMRGKRVGAGEFAYPVMEDSEV